MFESIPVKLFGRVESVEAVNPYFATSERIDFVDEKDPTETKYAKSLLSKLTLKRDSWTGEALEIAEALSRRPVQVPRPREMLSKLWSGSLATPSHGAIVVRPEKQA